MVKPFNQMKEKNTENLILEAARKVFITKGMDGARMQEIADEAGMNKALLHYYFRSKNRLFDRIFEDAFSKLFPQVQTFIGSDLSLFDIIRVFVQTYMDLILEHSYLPGFILQEVNRNPDRIINLIDSSGFNIHLLIDKISREVDKGTIKQIDPRTLIMNIIALCIFPVLAKPLLSKVLFKDDENAFEEVLENRKVEVADLIINSISK